MADIVASLHMAVDLKSGESLSILKITLLNVSANKNKHNKI